MFNDKYLDSIGEAHRLKIELDKLKIELENIRAENDAMRKHIESCCTGCNNCYESARDNLAISIDWD